MNAASIRGDWVGEKIDGKFPLIAWLGGSGTSGVFVTEIEDEGQKSADLTTSTPGLRRAAIKLLPATGLSEERLSIWASTAALSNPHLVRVLKSGRGAIDGTALIYVV